MLLLLHVGVGAVAVAVAVAAVPIITVVAHAKASSSSVRERISESLEIIYSQMFFSTFLSLMYFSVKSGMLCCCFLGK